MIDLRIWICIESWFLHSILVLTRISDWPHFCNFVMTLTMQLSTYYLSSTYCDVNNFDILNLKLQIQLKFGTLCMKNSVCGLNLIIVFGVSLQLKSFKSFKIKFDLFYQVMIFKLVSTGYLGSLFLLRPSNLLSLRQLVTWYYFCQFPCNRFHLGQIWLAFGSAND